MPEGVTLSPERWDSFVAESWDKSPVSLELLSPEDLPEPGAIFRALCQARGLTIRREFPIASWRFYVDKLQKYSGNQVEKLLPQDEDGSIDSYAERVSEEVGDRPFTLCFDSAQRIAPALWVELREFVLDLYGRTNLPEGTPDLEIVLSNSEEGAFGPHWEPGSAFLFVLSGSVVARFWSDEQWKRQPRRIRDPRSYRGDGERMRLERGGVVYRPPALHSLSECVGPSLYLSLSFSRNRQFAFSPGRSVSSVGTLVTEVERVTEVLGDGFWTGSGPLGGGFAFSCRRNPDQSDLIPPGILGDINRLGRISRSDELTMRLRAAWAERVTGLGFSVLPPLRAPAEVGLGDRIVGDRTTPVIFLAADTGSHAVVVCNGYSSPLNDFPEAAAVIGRINSGETVEVADLEASCQTGSRSALSAMLVFLYRARGIETEGGDGSDPAAGGGDQQ